MFSGVVIILVWDKIDIKAICLPGELDVGAIVMKDIKGIIYR